MISALENYRLCPDSLRIEDGPPLAEGGQGIVVIAKLGSLEGLPGSKLSSLEDKVVVKKRSFPDDFEYRRKFFNVSPLVESLRYTLTNHRFTKAFANELDILATLSHRNVDTLIGFSEDLENDVAWTVSLFQPNGSVRAFLALGEWDIPERIYLVSSASN